MAVLINQSAIESFSLRPHVTRILAGDAMRSCVPTSRPVARAHHRARRAVTRHRRLSNVRVLEAPANQILERPSWAVRRANVVYRSDPRRLARRAHARIATVRKTSPRPARSSARCAHAAFASSRFRNASRTRNRGAPSGTSPPGRPPAVRQTRAPVSLSSDVIMCVG